MRRRAQWFETKFPQDVHHFLRSRVHYPFLFLFFFFLGFLILQARCSLCFALGGRLTANVKRSSEITNFEKVTAGKLSRALLSGGGQNNISWQ